jgi:hypothetical protein
MEKESERQHHLMTQAFATMPGGEILSYVRNILVAVVTIKRSFAEQSAAVGMTLLTGEESRQLAALEAAADCLQYAVSVGQEAKVTGKPTPEWVLKMAAQARVALIAETNEAET